MPRYQHIARQLKTAIEQGELAPGSRLPSSRTWAQELGVSRATVENVYGELVAQGWLERRGQAGTFVSNALRFETEPPIPAVFAGESPEPKPFQMGLPALDLFPREKWARVMGRRLRTQTRFDLALGDVCGEAILRQAIVDYLRVSRSIECLPEQVFITSGYADSMRLILRTLSVPGDSMWVEDPGFPLIRPVITQEGITLADSGRCRWAECRGGDAGLPAGALCIGDARPPKSVGGGAVVNSPTATSGMGGECAGLDY